MVSHHPIITKSGGGGGTRYSSGFPKAWTISSSIIDGAWRIIGDLILLLICFLSFPWKWESISYLYDFSGFQLSLEWHYILTKSHYLLSLQSLQGCSPLGIAIRYLSFRFHRYKPDLIEKVSLQVDQLIEPASEDISAEATTCFSYILCCRPLKLLQAGFARHYHGYCFANCPQWRSDSLACKASPFPAPQAKTGRT